jgi:hypothetical protein
MLPTVHIAEMRTRCSPALRQKIKAAAEKSIRSLSAEIAFRLERSFDDGLRRYDERAPQ